MLYCSDISQFSLNEYPLVPYARLCKLSGWFAICLQNVYTGNDIYVLEFFLSARSKDDENILTTLSFILGTLQKKFKTFRLASGRELGELMSVEVIYFHNGQKSHSVQTIQASRFLKDGGLMLLPQLDQPSTDASNNGMNAFSEEQNHILDYHESLQNGEVTMQLDSCDQPLMNPLNNLQNIVTAERNITVAEALFGFPNPSSSVI
ncbi:hypothetical protein Vadar_018926 [Vaccinium darrowii]|uniref:Uncharacterized protein n=1 Tax=Vaccinium darrowii TaxID=229202 RepID=A0ACB7XII0_9ERIC|nr:hypothetical protein Vadar_018926 [Vaccinium darrowii]